MFQYTGTECPVCKNNFQKNDDIVVCPECGAPHHRVCYKESGQCAFDSLHQGGFEWKSPKKPEPAEQEPSFQNAQDAQSVHKEAPSEWYTSQPWAQEAVPRLHPYGGLSPDDEIDGIPVRDIAHYIGTSTGYYIRSFKNIHSSKKPIGWNWAALFFDFSFFFYRKMYIIGALLFAITLISNIATIYQLVSNAPALAQALSVSLDEYVNALRAISQTTAFFNLLGIIHNVLRVAGAIFANALYSKKVTSGIRAVRESSKDQVGSVEYYSSLAKKGGVNIPLVVVCALAVLISIVAPSFYIAGILFS